MKGFLLKNLTRTHSSAIILPDEKWRDRYEKNSNSKYKKFRRK